MPMLELIRLLSEELEQQRKKDASGKEKSESAEDLTSSASVSVNGQSVSIRDLLTTFPELTESEQQVILNALTKVQRKEDEAARIRQFKEVQMFKLKTWAIRVVLLVLLFLAVLFVSVFLFLSMRNGILSDATVLTSLFDTAKEVLKLIFIGN